MLRMRQRIGHEFWARAALTIGALLPYWRLLTFNVIYVTDDYFASDIFNGELPGRVLIGRLLRHGQWPVWTSQLCSGLPLVGSPAEPIGLAAFTLLPPAPALDLYVVILLLIAAHGAYTLARQFGAGRAGAVLAGIAFAGSGYIACQLKHLAIVSTVVWLPLGLVLLDRILAPAAGSARPRPRPLLFPLFGAVVAEQVLSGFPQSAYYCLLVYGAFTLFRIGAAVRRERGIRSVLPTAAAVALATVVGSAAGAVVLLPLWELGKVSDRAEAGWEWISRLAYWPPNAVTFLLPYFHGDISNNSYSGPPFFWEDYGYVGAAVFLLSIYGAVRERRRPAVMFTAAMTVVAYLFVLGPATPFFHAAFLVLPGMSVFRFPTRFLIVVELGIALLGAFGLTRLVSDLERAAKGRSRAIAAIAWLICAGTVVDLYVHQPRQNPMVPAREWLAPPAAVAIVHSENPEPRTFTPRHRDLHREAFEEADGWSNLEPYFQMRDVLDPNLGGGFWNTPSADCYDAIAPRWYVDVWGSDNRELSLMGLLTAVDTEDGTLRLQAAVPNLLRAYGVTHVLTQKPENGVSLPLAAHGADFYVYRVPGAARVRVVSKAEYLDSDRETAQRLLNPGFDPAREVLLNDVPAADRVQGAHSPGPVMAHAAIVKETSRDVVIDTDAVENGFLLLADTYYPGWSAAIDGKVVPIFRANLSVRAVPLPKGRHQVMFEYEMPGLTTGLRITLLAISALLVWAAAARYAMRREA